MFDTHCHLNFSRFKKNVAEVVERARVGGVEEIVVPGTDLKTSRKAVEVAEQYEDIYAAVGIHPHHVYEIVNKWVTDGGGLPTCAHEGKLDTRVSRSMGTLVPSNETTPKPALPAGRSLETGYLRFPKEHWWEETSVRTRLFTMLTHLLKYPKVVAVGEVGIDRHVYEQTKYSHYVVNDSFIDLQKDLFKEQMKLAIQYKKSLIVHNREAKKEVTEIMRELWTPFLERRSVFHCCEPDRELLKFAQQNRMFIGVDGDLTYRQDKQAFIRDVPLNMLVLETDAPFLLPEPLRSKKLYPNEPKNLVIIAKKVAEIKKAEVKTVIDETIRNARELFRLK